MVKKTINYNPKESYGLLGEQIESIIIEDEEGNFVAKLTKNDWTARKNCTVTIKTEMIKLK